MKKILLSSLSLALAGFGANAQVLHQWNFDDASGTDVGAATDSVGSATFSSFMGGSAGDFDTNGAGQILGTGTRYGNADIADVSSGIYQFDLSGITLAGLSGGTPDSVGFGIRSAPSSSISNPATFSAPGAAPRNLAVIAFGKQDATGGVDVQVYNNEVALAVLDDVVADFNQTLDFRIIWDFDSDTTDYQIQVNGGGFTNIVSQQTNTATTGEILSLGSSVLSDTISVDQATWSAVPEPSAYALIAGVLAFGWIAVRRRR